MNIKNKKFRAIFSAATCLTLAISSFSFVACGNTGSNHGSSAGGSSFYEDPAYNYYTITYDFGGAAENKTERVQAGTLLNPEAPTFKYSEYYNFVGWFKDAKFSEWENFDEPVYKDKTIYARLDPGAVNRELFLSRFNEEAEAIPAEKTSVAKVQLGGQYYTTEVEGGEKIEKHEKTVENNVTSFDVPFGDRTINYFLRVFYDEAAFKTDFYDNEEYEILSDSYVFHSVDNIGFTIVYKQKTDDKVYEFSASLNRYHRLESALFSMVLNADEHGHGTPVKFYWVFAYYLD